MKLNKHILCLAAFSMASSAYAQVQVDVTGATAFRAAALASIRARFVASGAPFKFAHDQAAGGLTGATRAIFTGTFRDKNNVDIPNTIVRTCFTGSVEGIKSLVDPGDTFATYYQPSLLNSTTATVSGAELASQGTTGALNDLSEIAFSDVTKALTPFGSFPLQPASPAAGVIVFTMLTNEGSAITNVTTQQFKALVSTGFQPLSLFTGNPADTTNVFATGRNDGSGTRSVYLTETGYGVANPINQYVANVSTSTALTTIQLVPQGGVGSPVLPGQLATNASTIWGNDVAGNGGYNSGSALRTDMGKTGLAVTVLDESGNDVNGSPVRADLVTWLSVNDAVTARNNGAVFCGYNGVRLDGIAASGTTLTPADKAKVTNGSYTAWSYEQMYRRNNLSDASLEGRVYDGIKSAIPTNLGAAGIALSDMNVFRSFDGGIVAP